MVLAVDIGNSNICIGGLTGAEHCSIQLVHNANGHAAPLYSG